MTWYGKHIRKKYRRRQVLWADALIQIPRKTGERNPVRDHEHFITTKFRKHPLSGSVVKADYVFPYKYMH